MKALLLSCLGLVLTFAAHGQTTFNDGTFNLASYSSTTPFTTGSISGSDSQCPSCGNPGQALQLVLTVPAGDSSFGEGFINNTFLYNPQTQGAISSVNAAIDKDVSSSFALNGFGNNFRVLLEQDGLYFVTSVAGAPVTIAAGGTTGYVTIAATGLTASSFDQIDPSTGAITATSHPNFAGDSISLGLAQITSFGGSPGGTYTVDYDNLSLTINAVPEPRVTACLFLGATLVGAAVSICRLKG